MFERTVSGNRGRILSRSHARISDAGHPPSFVSLTGLKNRGYDLVILHSLPTDKALYCQRYMDEQIYLTVEENHPVANKKSISFAEVLVVCRASNQSKYRAIFNAVRGYALWH